MAKKRKPARRPAPESTPPEDDPFVGIGEEAAQPKPAGKAADETASETPGASGGFLRGLGESLKAAGQAAEKYARMGVNVAELEKLRLQLRVAYARLGESVVKCWDAAPDIGVAAGDPAIKQPLNTVAELRRRIREIEIKLRQQQAK